MTRPMDIDSRLRALPCHDADPRVSDRIRRRALEELREQRVLVGKPWRARARRTWNLAEPILSLGVVGSYLAWLAMTLVSMAR